MIKSFPQHLPDNPGELEDIIARYEKESYPLKKGAEAKIVWADPKQKTKTPYSLVYLHGFKGSHGEGTPVHKTIANKFGFNLYLSRLPGHGQINMNRLGDLTAGQLIQSAEVACKIGTKIGEKVILMGSSTGGTLALHLAGATTFAPSIASLILYSPLIHLYGIQSLLLENSIGRQILSILPGREYPIRAADPFSPGESKVWYHSYQLNGALALGKLVQQALNPALFKQIQCPVFVGYYYKSTHNHDRVVSTSAIKRMVHTLGSPPEGVVLKNFPNANSHVICNSLLSNAIHDVIANTEHFLTTKVGLPNGIETRGVHF